MEASCRPEMRPRSRSSASKYPPVRTSVVANFFRSIVLLLAVLTNNHRLGEAAAPGPHIFANANTTGLMGKKYESCCAELLQCHLCGAGNTLNSTGYWTFQKGDHLAKYKVQPDTRGARSAKNPVLKNAWRQAHWGGLRKSLPTQIPRPPLVS